MKAFKLPDELKKYRFLIIAFLVGILLLLLPTHGKEEATSDDESRLAATLECIQGVGEANVLISENGVVVVCDGAWNAEVKLTVINAAEAFTGFTSDNIQVLKSIMEE